MKSKKVAVLMGGMSAERQVSLASGTAVSAGLQRAGFQVESIDVTHHIDEQLRQAAPDAVFIALHGRYGEDGTVQGLLELMKIPYTGSGVLASALAMDKIRTRNLLKASGLPVAPGAHVTAQNHEIPGEISLPMVVKPSTEGSSVGVSIVKTQEQLAGAIQEALQFCPHVLVERFIAGTEVNVAILDGEILGAVEIEPHREFYDYSAKYDAGGSTHHIPPRLPQETVAFAADLAKRAYDAIGCAGAARVDLIVPPDPSATVILEVNTIPGMTNTSLLPEIAAHGGVSFDQLVTRMIEGASLNR